jgi:cardiolipin synthase (CMP-forming)
MITDLPNVLTLSRIAAIPVLIVLASLRLPVGDLAACIVFAAAGVTDYLDGRLARSRQQFSDLGRMLDPIADKLLVGAVLIMLAGDGRLGPWGLYPAIVIMLREILVSGLREFLAEIRIGLPVTRLAKWKTTAQIGSLGFLIAGDSTARLLHISWLHPWLIGTVLLWISALLTIVTGWDYLVAGLRYAEVGAAGRGQGKPGAPDGKISLS